MRIVSLVAVVALAACTSEPLVIDRTEPAEDAARIPDDEPDDPNEDPGEDPEVPPQDPEEPQEPPDAEILPIDSCEFTAMVRASVPAFDEAQVTASLEELVSACDVNGDSTTAPQLVPPAPATTDLPPECDEESRVAALIERCGPLEESTLDAASCAGRTCHVVLGAGTFPAPANGLSCAFVEGTGGTTLIVGGATVSDVVIARVRWDGEYGALSVMGDLLVNEAHISGDYEALSASWDADYDIAVCRSRVRAGYSGIGQSWESRRLTVAGNAIASCYEGAASAWGSSELVVEQNILISAFDGVNIHESSCTAVVDNVIAAGSSAVSTTIWPICDPATMGDCSFDPPTQRVLVDGNTVLSGVLPETMEDRQIFVNP